MPAGNVVLYSKNKDRLNPGDLVGVPVKLALLSSAYAPDASVTGNSLFSEISANEIAATGGYAAGGFTLASPTATAITGGFRFNTGNASITAAGGTVPAWRYGVLYVSGTLWGRTNPVIGYFLGDNAPADVPATTAGNTLTVTCPAAGWFDAT